MEAGGGFYAELLRDMDALVATDAAFLLGPWLAMARRLAEDDTTGTGTGISGTGTETSGTGTETSGTGTGTGTKGIGGAGGTSASDAAFDCENDYGIGTCADFLEWNARAQLTTSHFSDRRRHVWGPGAAASVETLKAEVAELLKEYLLSGEEDEAVRCVRALHAPARIRRPAPPSASSTSGALERHLR